MSSFIVRANIFLTAIFGVTAVLAAVLFNQPWKTIAVVTSLVCFTVGVVAFLWGYWTAVQRSREDNIGVANLYFLLDGCAPSAVSRTMNIVLGAQVVIGLGTALARMQTAGRTGSTLAFGILVPMLGLGLNGLWGAQHGTFPSRSTAQNSGDSSGVSHETSQNGHDESHD
jgi:hypothetical protein